MMVLKLHFFALSLIIAVAQGHKAQNSVLADEGSPKVITHNNAYYMVTIDDAFSNENWFPIYLSGDLLIWTRIAFVFDVDNRPTWTSNTSLLYAPSLHYQDGYFYLFFDANETSSGVNRIGVAKSQSIEGPYVSELKPLDLPTASSVHHAVIFEDNTSGDTYLTWTQYGEYYDIWGQIIDLADLTLSEDAPTNLLKPTLPWEGSAIFAPSFLYKNNFYYIFYSASFSCGDIAAIGVARSQFVMGPYEKVDTPILNVKTTWPNVLTIGQPNEISNVILYQGGCFPASVIVNALLWNSDDWPYVPQK